LPVQQQQQQQQQSLMPTGRGQPGSAANSFVPPAVAASPQVSRPVTASPAPGARSPLVPVCVSGTLPFAAMATPKTTAPLLSRGMPSDVNSVRTMSPPAQDRRLSALPGDMDKTMPPNQVPVHPRQSLTRGRSQPAPRHNTMLQVNTTEQIDQQQCFAVAEAEQETGVSLEMQNAIEQLQSEFSACQDRLQKQLGSDRAERRSEAEELRVEFRKELQTQLEAYLNVSEQQAQLSNLELRTGYMEAQVKELDIQQCSKAQAADVETYVDMLRTEILAERAYREDEKTQHERFMVEWQQHKAHIEAMDASLIALREGTASSEERFCAHTSKFDAWFLALQADVDVLKNQLNQRPPSDIDTHALQQDLQTSTSDMQQGIRTMSATLAATEVALREELEAVRCTFETSVSALRAEVCESAQHAGQVDFLQQLVDAVREDVSRMGAAAESDRAAHTKAIATAEEANLRVEQIASTASGRISRLESNVERLEAAEAERKVSSAETDAHGATDNEQAACNSQGLSDVWEELAVLKATMQARESTASAEADLQRFEMESQAAFLDLAPRVQRLEEFTAEVSLAFQATREAKAAVAAEEEEEAWRHPAAAAFADDHRTSARVASPPEQVAAAAVVERLPVVDDSAPLKYQEALLMAGAGMQNPHSDGSWPTSEPRKFASFDDQQDSKLDIQEVPVAQGIGPYSGWMAEQSPEEMQEEQEWTRTLLLEELRSFHAAKKEGVNDTPEPSNREKDTAANLNASAQEFPSMEKTTQGLLAAANLDISVPGMLSVEQVAQIPTPTGRTAEISSGQAMDEFA